jgi:hypothetical protein
MTNQDDGMFVAQTSITNEVHLFFLKAFFRTSIGVVVDHDPCVQPERGDEAAGAGNRMGRPASEGDPVRVDPPAGAGGRTRTEDDRSGQREASLPWDVTSRAFHDWRDGVAAGRVGRPRFRKKSRVEYGGKGVRAERGEHDPQEA